MVEIIIDSAMIQTILAFSAPFIALVITYLKKKLGYEQGDMIFEQLKFWAKQLDELANIFTELKPLSSELTVLLADAEDLWKDPANNSDKLAEVFSRASKIYTEALVLLTAFKKEHSTTLTDVLREAA